MIIAMRPRRIDGDPAEFRLPSEEEQAANFRLIDAAPGMLATLKIAADALTSTLKARGYEAGSATDGWAPEVRQEVAALATVRAAIAKAEG